MILRRLTALCFLVLVVPACNDSHSPTAPPPPPPPAATIVGGWSGTQTVSDVQPRDLCVAYNYVGNRLNRAETVTATFSQSGSTITIQYSTPFGVYTATGTLNGQSFSATTTGVVPAEHSLTCRINGNGRMVTRIVSLANQTIEGSADSGFTAITGTVTTRENTRSTGGANTDPVTTIAALALRK